MSFVFLLATAFTIIWSMINFNGLLDGSGSFGNG
jgi:hypothetical protein